MSSKKIFILIAFMTFVLTAFGFQNSSEHKVLFEKAKFTMETKGDLKGAIKLFNEIIKKYPDEREYAAKSQLYIGLCYEKLGLKQAKHAQKAFQKVVDNYPEQTETVKMANEKLSLILKAKIVVEKGDKEFKIRKVLEFPAGEIPSLDGHYATYVDWDTGDVVLHELDTGKTSRLTNEGTWKKPMQFALYSIVSPDNKLIAYCWYNLHETYDLRLIGIDGSNRRILYSDKDYEVYPASWSYDGKHIAVMNYNKENGGFQIALVAVADGSLRVLNTNEKLVFPRLCYSPDDRYIVYDYPVDKDSGNRDLSLFAVDGSGETPLVKHPADDKLLGWVPMRKEILFLSDRSGTKDIWIIQAADGKPQGSPKPIKRNIGEISPPLALTQDGYFYFSIFTRWFTTQVAPFDLATGKIQEQSAQAILGSTSFPAWSPKGEYLAFITEQKESREAGYHRPLHIRHIKTAEERELAGDFETRAPRWSPDGSSILVVGFDNKRRKEKDYNGGLYKIDIQDELVTEIVLFPPVQDWERDTWWIRSIAEWSIDGKSVFYVQRGKIFMRELESGSEKQLYQNPNLTKLLDLSPDGKMLVFGTEDRDKGIWSISIMPVSGGEPKELCKFKELERIRDVTWTPDGKYLFITENKKKGSILWRISPEGGDLQRIWQSKNKNAGLSIHPEGKQIAFSTYVIETETWVMENFLPEEKSQRK